MKVILEVDRINRTSQRSRQAMEKKIARVKEMKADTQKSARQASQRCRLCFYREPRLYTQAFSHKNCDICNQEVTYPTSKQSAICSSCSKTHGLCIDCGANQEYQDR